MPSPTEFPQPFGKYRLLRKLARGGMAELFLATEAGRSKPVVIKRVLPHFTQDAEFLKMFLNEARIAALLNHPSIVQVYNLGKEGEHLFIAMEFVDGFDLETLTKFSAGKMPPLVVARVGADVCDALYYANRVTDLEGKPLNIVHRDVTPGNVMITRGGSVKLVDFGVAKAAAQLERTRPGVVKGKFRYMSPEQVTFKELDGRSDMFSLGVLMYEVTAGERPFERKQIIDIIRAITDWTPPTPAESVKGYPKALSQVIMRALEKDRDKRYRHAREMQIALDQALTKTPTGKAELAAYVAELARAHPKEMAPVAPEFGDLEQPDQTDPVRPNRISEVEAREKAEARRSSRPEFDPASNGPPVQRTEAISGNEVKRMIEAADRRAAARASSSNLPRSPSKQSMRAVPALTVGPPSEEEATALGADDDEETTTNPVSRAPRPAPPALGRNLDDEPVPSDGPSTARMDRVSQLQQRSSRRPSRGAPLPGDLEPGGELGDEDEGPTISGVRNFREPVEPLDPSAVSEVSGARRRAMRRTLLVFAGLCIVATLIFLILTLLSTRTSVEDIPPQVRDGVKLGAQPIDHVEHPGKNAAVEPAAGADGDDGGVGEAAAPSGETGTLTVDCSGACAGLKVAIDGRAFQDVPMDVVLSAGPHKCTMALKSGKKKPCPHAVVVEAGKQITIKVP